MDPLPAHEPTDVAFALPDVELKGQRFGQPISAHKVIALHGWLDNAASFSRLLPLVDDIDCVAIDMAGHGQSGGRVGHSSYNIWEDLRDVREVAEQMGWSRFFLLAHSRGAAVAMLYAGAFPDQVSGTFMIDGLLPITVEANDLPDNLAKSIVAMQAGQRAQHQRSYFQTRDDAIEARMKSFLPVSRNAALALGERAVMHDPERGYYWRYDRRLKVGSEVRLTLAQSFAFLDRLARPAEVVVASDGVIPRMAPKLLANGHRNVVFNEYEGVHHLHLEDDLATRRAIAEALKRALASAART